ncbi:MAG: YbhB/YbcL family Raf kinase inhibitor-like protein [Frankia sp.]
MSLLDRGTPPGPYDVLPPKPSFTLESEDLKPGEPHSPTHAHASTGGADRSPQLSWSGFPPETQSFAITVYDPDAPTGSGFWHWVLVDIPASVTELPQGAGSGDLADLPAGAFHVRNDFGTKNYGGSGPPEGDRAHRYYIAVHALDVPSLGVDDTVSPAYVGFNLTFHTLARAVLMVTYQR